MANVGLLFVGAVLFINGLMLLGKVDPRAAAVFNLFVGALQVVTPTFLIFTAGGDQRAVLAASGIYLFGFTYLYVGIGLLLGLDTTGVGYFSLFVSIMALAYSFVSFRILDDRPFGVIWLYWSFLWLLFFLLLGLKITGITVFTGWVTAIQGWVTGAIPAFLLLAGYWRNSDEVALALGIFAVVVFGGLWVLTRPRQQAGGRSEGSAAATDTR
ncbi:MAG TPA: AmiS/UreI family transporter [Streptomyces sp.]|uniref:AmiS/UreI family transporter n=1 Tax=Streptomyces sp. TaxID=1931 RepID=UPI002D565D2F|nr:AmiS/UreI family transporter [Streptomyces sp.]HZG06529.1 AmiS/UreI family transporter [Streptomyces sp.]